MCFVLGGWWNFRCFFFFSSRRRHTRLYGDWSSDVCSSDLAWLHLEVVRGILDEAARGSSEEPGQIGGEELAGQGKGHRRIGDGPIHGVAEAAESGRVLFGRDPVDGHELPQRTRFHERYAARKSRKLGATTSSIVTPSCGRVRRY